MTLIQVALVTAITALIIGGFVSTIKGFIRRRECVAWTLVCVVAVVSVIWPDITRRAAAFFGIGRGADLLLYGSVVVMMLGFLMTYVRLQRLRRELTLLVRHLAIRDAVEVPDSSKNLADAIDEELAAQ
jgi:small membrane protein